MSTQEYYILSRIDLDEGKTWQEWVDGDAPSFEVILGVFKTEEGAYVNMREAYTSDDTHGYCMQQFCSCHGKFVKGNVIWFDPDTKQLYGMVN